MNNIEDELTHDKLKHMENIFIDADTDAEEGLSMDEFRQVTWCKQTVTSRGCCYWLFGVLFNRDAVRKVFGDEGFGWLSDHQCDLLFMKVRQQTIHSSLTKTTQNLNVLHRVSTCRLTQTSMILSIGTNTSLTPCSSFKRKRSLQRPINEYFPDGAELSRHVGR